MINIEDVDLLDFYYNGHWLSEFDGMIAGTNGIEDFTVRPSMEIKTEKIIGVDGELFQSAYYNPRTFSLPIMFEDLNKIRDISSWLDVKTPTDFYFKDDKLKIKVMLDSAIDVKPYVMQGTTDLKFIAHNPFFEAVDDIKYIIKSFDRTFSQINPLELYNTVSITTYDRYTPASYELTQINTSEEIETLVSADFNLYVDGMVTKNNSEITLQTTSFTNIEIFNDGNKESYPLITIYMVNSTKGNVTLSINGEVMSVTDVKNYITIDTKYMTIIGDEEVDSITLEDQNRLKSFSGEFINLKTGKNTITATGNINKIEIQCRSRWI